MDRKRKIALDDSVTKKTKATSEGGDEVEINPWTGVPFSARYYSILEKRQKLPVYQFKDKLIDCVKENQIVVVEGETGSGKTTQVSVFLLGFNMFSILCDPR